MSDHWAEANGGIRGSTLLRAGAVVYFFAALIHLATRLLVPEATGPDNPAFLAALLVWDLALFLLAAGFFWTGVHPFLTRFGIGLGLFILIQATYLMLSLATRTTFPFPPSILTVGRTLLIGLFALVERRNIGDKVAIVLGLCSGVQFLRVFLRNTRIWPPLAEPWEAILSTVFMVITAGALYALGNDVRGHERQWARAHVPDRMAKFNDFNNPLHHKKPEKENRAKG